MIFNVTEGRFLGLRTAALIAVLAGATGSVGLLLRATNRNPSHLLVVLLAIWVVSPFVALFWASIVSKRWSVQTRVTLYGVMLVVPLSCLAIYVADAIWPAHRRALSYSFQSHQCRGCLAHSLSWQPH